MNTNLVSSFHGFTLAEVLVSFLLLSILTVGSFKSFHLVQAGASSNLSRFLQLQMERQTQVIERLRLRYSSISTEDGFDDLDCLLQADCDA